MGPFTFLTPSCEYFRLYQDSFKLEIFTFNNKTSRESTISALAELKETTEPLQKLQADIDSFTKLSDDLKLRKDTGRQLETLLANNVDALTTNIKDHLGNSPKAIDAYAIFNPLLLPSSDEDSFKEYGEVEVNIIANHFFPGNEDKMTKLLCQWLQVKFFRSGKNCKYQLETKAIPSSCPSF